MVRLCRKSWQEHVIISMCSHSIKWEKSSFPVSLQIVNCSCWLIPNAAVIADRCWVYFGGTDTLGFIRWCKVPFRLRSCCATLHLQMCHAWDHELQKALKCLQIGTVALQMGADPNGILFQHGIRNADM